MLGVQTSIYEGIYEPFSHPRIAKHIKSNLQKKCVAYLMCQVAVGSRARGVELSGGADDAVCGARAVPPYGRLSGNGEFRRQRERRKFPAH